LFESGGLTNIIKLIARDVNCQQHALQDPMRFIIVNG